MSAEQRVKALEKAAAARTQRAEMKERLKSGELSFEEVLQQSETDEVVGKTKVLTVLESLPGLGKVRSRRLMAKVGVAESRRMRGMGPQQRVALQRELEENPAK